MFLMASSQPVVTALFALHAVCCMPASACELLRGLPTRLCTPTREQSLRPVSSRALTALLLLISTPRSAP